jgi:hypothetical protein
VLIREAEGERPEQNQWGITFRQGLFNMTSDSRLFRTREQLEAEGWWLEGNVFRKAGVAYLPLYEGKMIHLFNHRFSTYQRATQAQLNVGTLPQLTEENLSSPTAVIQPSYWVSLADLDASLGDSKGRRWLLGFRDITNTTNERTIICATLPRVAVGHTCPLMFVSKAAAVAAAAFVASISSFVADYVARQ